MKRVSHSTKASERPSRRKKVIQTDKSFQRISNPNQAGDPSCKSNQVDMHDKVKSVTRLAVKGKFR